MKFCSSCGAQYGDTSQYCPTCGQRCTANAETTAPVYSEITIAFCPQCGEKAAGRYCGDCGAFLSSTELKGAAFSLGLGNLGSNIGGIIAKSPKSQELGKAGERLGQASERLLTKTGIGHFTREDVMQGLRFTAILTCISTVFVLFLSLTSLGTLPVSLLKKFSYLYGMGYALQPSATLSFLKSLQVSTSVLTPIFGVLFTGLAFWLAEWVRQLLAKQPMRFRGMLCAAASNAVVVTLIVQFTRFSYQLEIPRNKLMDLLPDEVTGMINGAISLKAGMGFVLPLLITFVLSFCLLAIGGGYLRQKNADRLGAPVLAFSGAGFRLFGNAAMLYVPAMFLSLLFVLIRLDWGDIAPILWTSIPLGSLAMILFSGGVFSLFQEPASLGASSSALNELGVQQIFGLDLTPITLFALLAMLLLVLCAFYQAYRLWSRYKTESLQSAALRGAAFAGTYALAVAALGVIFRMGVHFSIRFIGTEEVWSLLQMTTDISSKSAEATLSTLGGAFTRNLIVIFILFFVISMLAYVTHHALKTELFPVILEKLLAPLCALLLTLFAIVGVNMAMDEGERMFSSAINSLENIADIGGMTEDILDGLANIVDVTSISPQDILSRIDKFI